MARVVSSTGRPSSGNSQRCATRSFRQVQTTEMKVLDIVHERGRAYPLAELDYSGKKFYIPAVSGTIVGSQIQIGPQATVASGNILPLSNIPEGTAICNIERYLGDGGRLVRQAGESLYYSLIQFKAPPSECLQVVLLFFRQSAGPRLEL